MTQHILVTRGSLPELIKLKRMIAAFLLGVLGLAGTALANEDMSSRDFMEAMELLIEDMENCKTAELCGLVAQQAEQHAAAFQTTDLSQCSDACMHQIKVRVLQYAIVAENKKASLQISAIRSRQAAREEALREEAGLLHEDLSR